ncbi:type II secretion system inner membrane protein GspF [Desulforegula conservatrix]|uniref:type II secretion system inner membrane protein GspF n=1 Tax=Desulforegula conservatrix TaxID=153026 RepID=UPI00040ACA48|nr:type II secretion system inner membrane protein GspF [Desulforegula conservatrix]
MPVYEYNALTGKGKTTKGIINAESLSAAKSRLKSTGLYPVSVIEAESEKKKTIERIKQVSFFSKSVKTSELAIFTRQLASLIASGFPLVSAIGALIAQLSNPFFQKKISQIKEAIEEGQSFAGSLEEHSDIFNPVYINMVKAGESSGTLDLVLDRLASIIESRHMLATKLKTAMAYPVLMCIIGTLILFLLMTYIVPNITSIFTDMNQALPWPTRLLITVSNFFRSFWWLLIGIIALTPTVLYRIREKPGGRKKIDGLMLKIPLIGTLIQKIGAARFARTLGSLLANGVPILTSLEIVETVVNNVLFTEAVQKASKAVEQGKSLGESLADSAILPHIAIQMITVGEQSGNLESMLERAADIFENEVESTVATITSLMEPIMILAMGIVVGFIVVAICLPIFEMNQLIK